MNSLGDVFAHLRSDGDVDGIYTTLAPLYRATYAARGRIEGQLAVASEHAPPPVTNVFELGCGTGDLAAALDERYPRVVGLDTSAEMCHVAAAHGPTCRASASALAPSTFDLGVAMGAVLGHIRPAAERKTALTHVRDALAPGGRFVCSVHDRRGLSEPRRRRLTTTVDGFRIHQYDVQRPAADGTFDWQVSFEMTDLDSGRTAETTTTTRLRSFTPEELTGLFETADLRPVRTTPREFVAGDGEDGRAFVAVAERPRDR
jgi:SAM-dependent methyltransferase